MSSVLLLDPAILSTRSIENGSVTWDSYWTRLMGWESDSRVKLGPRTFAFGFEVAGIQNSLESPEYDYPPHTRRDRRRIVMKLLGRVIDGGSMSDDMELARICPEHITEPAARDALLDDVVSGVASPHGIAGIATASGHWDPAQAMGSLELLERTIFEMCFAPGDVLEAERDALLKSSIKGRRVSIVGGKRTPRVVEELEGRGAEVRWLECSRTRKPNMESWKALEPGRDLACCITGQIGHSTSNKADRLAEDLKVDYLRIEFISGIVDAITEWCLRANHVPGGSSSIA